jgi:23S rRNA (guanosine2251-2'-O)-methyltransferase
VERLPYRATLQASAYDDIQTLPVRVLLDNVRSMYNVGAFFRTADGVALEHLHLSGITGRPPKKEITKTALGADEHVPWTGVAEPAAALHELHRQGYEIAAIETSNHSVDLFDWEPRFPVCVVFGHEVEGIQPELLAACHTHIRLPMLGRKHSLNVATAGGIVLYELLRKYRRQLER